MAGCISIIMDERLIDALRAIPNFERLIFAYIFGSQAGKTATPSSDTDLCLYYDLSEDDLFEQDILVMAGLPEYIDASLFQTLPMQVRINVFSGRMIYASDMDRAYDIAYETHKRYGLFRPLYLEVIG